MNPSPWLAQYLERELFSDPDRPEILAGPEAIDLASMVGLQLNRTPARKGDARDTAPSTANDLVAGGVSPFDFYIDLLELTPQESADCIMSLLGLWQAYHSHTPEGMTR